MKKICKYCGATYDGDPGSSACPDCVAAQKKTTIRPRTCRQCGQTFPGGPRAWYCPDCRAERRKDAAARYRRGGASRPIGSTDVCEVCGAEYVVNSARQRYCPKCAPARYREIDRQHSKRWNAENTTPEERKAVRTAANAQIPCVVCGKMFVPTDASITCSPECSRINHSNNCASWVKANRNYYNAYQLKRIREKIDAMTPEEYKAYRDKVNANAHRNHAARKARKNQK